MLSSMFWDDPWGTPQQLAVRLSTRMPVLYVEPSPSHPYVRSPRLNARWLRSGGRPREVGPGLFVYTPPPQLPLKTRSGVINSLSQRFTAPAIRRAAGRVGIARPYLISFLPHVHVVLGHFAERLVCYYCIDDMTALSRVIDPRVVHGYEQAMLRGSDLVLATARTVADRLARDHPRVRLLPNGSAPELYARALDERTSRPLALADCRAPILGFSGSIDFRVDIDLVAALAQAHPEWSFVFVGPVRCDVSMLSGLGNVLFVGQKPVEELPAYFKAFDAGLIPYRINRMVESINPVKFYDYLSAGLPVVSTAIPDIAHVRPPLGHIARSLPEFEAGIRASLVDAGQEAVAQRLAFARQQSWEVRAGTLVDLLRETERS